MKILIAEDEAEQRELVCYCIHLVHPKAEIVETACGLQTIASLNKDIITHNLPDLVILDLNMPGMDGRNVLLEMKSNPHLASLPIAFFTSSTAPIDRMFGKFKKTPLFTKSMNLSECKAGVTNIFNWYNETWAQKL